MLPLVAFFKMVMIVTFLVDATLASFISCTSTTESSMIFGVEYGIEFEIVTISNLLISLSYLEMNQSYAEVFKLTCDSISTEVFDKKLKPELGGS